MPYMLYAMRSMTMSRPMVEHRQPGAKQPSRCSAIEESNNSQPFPSKTILWQLFYSQVELSKKNQTNHVLNLQLRNLMLNSILFSSNTNIDFFGDFQLTRDYLPIGGSAPLKFAMLISKSRISGCLGGKKVILKDSVIQSEWVAWVDKKEGANVIITIIYDSNTQEDNKLTSTIRRRGDSNP